MKGLEKVKNYFEKIKENRDVRQNLSALREAVKAYEKREELLELFDGEPAVLLDKLSSEDAKVRKNTALILGVLGREACREPLIEAYEKEEQRFVRSAYLKGLQGLDCSPYFDRLRKRRMELLKEERRPENEKHLREELEALNALLLKQKAPERHKFTGYDVPSDVILTTHRAYREQTAEQLKSGKLTLLKAGVKIRQADLREILPVRTYRELLFCLEETKGISREEGAGELLEGGFLSLLDALHRGEEPYRYRIECKSRMTLEERSAFTKKLALELELQTGGRLVNSTSDYEVELRLIETREGDFLPLVKLYTLPDKRFSYRKNSVAASIRPVQAALLMALAKPYLRENARVLDPFCGVGTMLLERNYLVHADTLYGVDSYGPAIEGARENAEIAGVPAHYVNRNFFDFTHDRLFDELVSNLPVKGRNCTGHELDFLYGKLFDKAEELLQPGGRLFLYSHDRSFVKKRIREHKSMELLREWLINDREESWFFAVEFHG